MHHVLLAVAAAPHKGSWQHYLTVAWGFIQRFIKVIAIVVIVGMLIWRGGLNWIHAIIMLALGALIVVGFSPKVGAFVEKINTGNTVTSTGATIGELVVLGVLFVLAIFASRG